MRRYFQVAGHALGAVLLVTMLLLGLSRSDVPAPASSTVYLDNSRGHGSAVHIGGGVFLTAAHVVANTEKGKLTVKTDLGDEFAADVLWQNPDYDIALVIARLTKPVSAAYLNCSASDPREKAPIEIIGNPLNLLNVHTRGTVARATASYTFPRIALIADITVAPGNSGGPVFGRDGRLVGIVSAMAAMPMGPMGFGSALFPLTYVVPSSAICTLLGRAS